MSALVNGAVRQSGGQNVAPTRIVRLVLVATTASMLGSAMMATESYAQPVHVGGRARQSGVQAGETGQSPRLSAPKRAEMERRVQERINEVIRQRLELDDEQVVKLRDVSGRVEDERRAVRNEELTTRFALRQELLAGDRVNEARVGELLDRLPKLERRRVELIEAEQRELAKFLTPSQRARYFALQDELRRNMQEMQRRRIGLDGPPDSTGMLPRRPMGRGRPPGDGR